jgi:hypothetical protein
MFVPLSELQDEMSMNAKCRELDAACNHNVTDAYGSEPEKKKLQFQTPYNRIGNG